MMSAGVVAPRWGGGLDVTLVVAEGAPPVAAFVRDLERELTEVKVASFDAIASQSLADDGLALFWLAAGPSPSLCADLVAWADGRSPRPGLVGCIPHGVGADAEVALAAGFDDVVVGDPSPRELAARLRALHRRVHGAGRGGRLRFGRALLDVDSNILWVDGRPHTLTAMELAVMRALVRARGRTLSRGDLLDAAWGDGNLEVSERAVDNVVLRLRRKLSRPGLIHTVRGVGFRLAVE